MPYWDHIQRQALADTLQALVLGSPRLSALSSPPPGGAPKAHIFALDAI